MSGAPFTIPGTLRCRTIWLFVQLNSLWRKNVAAHLAPDLNLNRYAVLCCLAEFGPMFHKELTARLALDSGDLVGVLDHLQRNLLITRSQDDEDRRCVELRITSHGTQRLNDAQKQLEDCEDRTLSALLPDERASLHALLSRVTNGATTRGD